MNHIHVVIPIHMYISPSLSPDSFIPVSPLKTAQLDQPITQNQRRQAACVLAALTTALVGPAGAP